MIWKAAGGSSRRLSGPRMSFTLLTHTSKGSVAGASITTDAIDSTGANLLLIGVSEYLGNGGTWTVSDSKSNALTQLTAHEIASSQRSQLTYAKNPSSVGSGHTATDTVSQNSFPTVHFAAFSGADTTASADQENGATTASTTSLATGSVTPSADNELIIAHISLFASVTNLAIDSGFTILDPIDKTANHMGGAIAYKIQTTAAAENPTWSWTTAVQACASIATFKAAPSGSIGEDDGFFQYLVTTR